MRRSGYALMSGIVLAGVAFAAYRWRQAEVENERLAAANAASLRPTPRRRAAAKSASPPTAVAAPKLVAPPTAGGASVGAAAPAAGETAAAATAGSSSFSARAQAERPVAATVSAPPDADADPEAQWRWLERGNARFVAGRPAARDLAAERRALAEGGRPRAAVLTASEAAVAPEALFDLGFGELCVVRTPGAAADPSAVRALEDAVVRWRVGLLVVLGVEGSDAGPPAGGPDGVAVDAVAAALLRRSATLRNAAEAGRLTVVRATSDARTGAVLRRTNVGEASLEDLWTELAEGNRRFVEGIAAPTPAASLRAAATAAPAPRAVVLAATDPRVAPEAVFGRGAGELFVVRCDARRPDAEALADAEAAVRDRRMRLVVVLGQGRGARVAIDGGPSAAGRAGSSGETTAAAVSGGTSVVSGAVDDANARAALAAVDPVELTRAVLERSAYLRGAVAGGDAEIVPCVYDVATGRVARLARPQPGAAGASAADAEPPPPAAIGGVRAADWGRREPPGVTMR